MLLMASCSTLHKVSNESVHVRDSVVVVVSHVTDTTHVIIRDTIITEEKREQEVTAEIECEGGVYDTTTGTLTGIKGLRFKANLSEIIKSESTHNVDATRATEQMDSSAIVDVVIDEDAHEEVERIPTSLPFGNGIALLAFLIIVYVGVKWCGDE